MKKKFSLRLSGVISLIFTTTLAGAQDYPTKPVRFIAPFPPGGTTDVLARVLAQKLGDALGRQFIVENRPGASGNIGAELAVKAAPDGYTLVLLASSALVINPFLYKRMTFDPLNDFAPISMVAAGGQVFVVHPSVPVRSVKELIALARAQPGKLTFSSGGKGFGSSSFISSAAGLSRANCSLSESIHAKCGRCARNSHATMTSPCMATEQTKASTNRLAWSRRGRWALKAAKSIARTVTADGERGKHVCGTPRSTTAKHSVCLRP